MHSRGTRALGASRTTRWTTTLLAVIALILGTAAPAFAGSASTVPTTAGSTQTLVGGPVKTSLAGFAPGNIISDAVFTNKSTMTEAQIQAFFKSKVKTCRGGIDEDGRAIICLKDFKTDTVNRPADTYCKGYTGAKGESAARIIYRVAQSCNINPQVLIVMLQKEQSLVTHTWPSAWRYDKALGQGCPDDAGCNPKYVGFFYQIYGAGRQMQTYMEGRYFTWYAPGKTWNIQYHPNKGCGTAPVRVANKATSALYYYTPYQPNAAAIRAGYGTGDSCSSYGNRNFYNYFTDWFGSTQAPSTVRQGLVIEGKNVWLLSGDLRYHVTPEAYPEYKAVLGSPASVTASALTVYKVGTTRGSLFVRNSSTGVVALLQDGTTHRFGSCTTVAQWGGACGAGLVQLSNALFTKFRAGQEVTGFARIERAGRVHEIVGSTLQPLYDTTVAAALNAGVSPYAAVLPDAGVKKYSIAARLRFAPSGFIKVSGTSEVWLPAADGKLYHLPSWPHAAEAGLPSKVGTTVPTSAISGYVKAGDLSQFFVCGGRTYIAAGGALARFAGVVPTGFRAVSLDSESCALLRLTGTDVPGPAAFVRFDDSNRIYHLTAGQYREVTTVEQRKAINGGQAPTVLTMSADVKAKAPIGAVFPAGRSLIRVTGTSEVWMVDADRLWHLPSWDMAAEWGLARTSTVVSAAAVTGMKKSGELRPLAECSGRLYVAAGGRLVPVDPARLGGNATSNMTADGCRPASTATATGRIFLTDGARTVVAVGGGFLKLNSKESVVRAAAGEPQVSHRVAAGYLNRLPAASVPGQGSLVRASNESTVTLISDGSRLRLPNWGIGADLGVQARYQIVPPEAIANSAVSAGAELSIVVKCAERSFVASGGTLHAVTTRALSGWAPVTLSSATCATLRISSDAPLDAFHIAGPDGVRYAFSNGILRQAENGTTTPVLSVDARTIDAMR